MVQLVYKIVDAEVWALAVGQGVFAGAPVDLADGFIHFSASHQVRETAARHFARRNGLLLVAFDVEALRAALKWEESRGGDLFPHLYDALDPGLAVSVEPLSLDTEGRHVFPSGIP